MAGKANVLYSQILMLVILGTSLFRDLQKAEAYGPLTQGIAAPVNDLSRAARKKDYSRAVAITAVQCMAVSEIK